MNIGVTAEWIGTMAGGPERYQLNLIKEMAALSANTAFSAYLCAPPPIDWVKGLTPNVSMRSVGASRWKAIPFGVPFEMLRRPIDLLHATYVAPPLSPKPFVLTIHDLGFELFPEFFPASLRLRLSKLTEWGVKRARLIIADSEETRRTLEQVYGVDSRKISVVLLGCPPDFQKTPQAEDALVRSRYKLPPEYLLYVGKLQARKNTARLLRAYAKLKKRYPETPDLVLVGRRTWLSDETFASLESSGVTAHIHIIGHVDDAELPAIYRGASVFIFPSLFEGFGFPLLEAMASAVPVASSDLSSLPEVGGDAVVYFDALNEDDIAEKVHTLLNDSALRASLIERGLERIKQFTWETTARQTIDVYTRALS